MTALTSAATEPAAPRVEVAVLGLELLLRLIPAAVWTTDAHLHITHVSGRVPALHGVDGARALTMTVQELVGARAPSDPSVAAHFAALAGQRQSFDYELGGRSFNVLVDPLRDASGAIIGCVGAAVDATDQLRADEDLADNKRRMEEAQRVAHVGSFEWDVSHDRVTWSDELCRIYGVDKNHIKGTFDELRSFVVSDDNATVDQMVSHAVLDPKPFSYEHRIVRPDGNVRVLHTQGDVIVDDGLPLRVVAASWDVTDTAEAQAQLRRAKSLLEATLNATADGILVIDRGGHVTIYNPRFLALWNLTEKVVATSADASLLQVVADQLEDPDGFLRDVRELYDHPEREDFDVLHFKDGRVYERYSRPQCTGKEITGRVWSFRDVTERDRLLQRALFIADAARLLATLDAEAALVAVAHLAVPFLGETCAVDLALAHDEDPRRLVVASREGDTTGPHVPGAVHVGHASYFQANGRSCLAVPLSAHGAVVGSISLVAAAARTYDEYDLELCEDLAQRVSLTLANAHLYREAEEALRSRDEFLAIAAHEIRGPIASMHLALQTLARGSDSAVASRLLKIIGHDEERLTRFVDELLDVGRIRSGQLSFAYESVDIAEVVRDVATRLAPELTAAGSKLTIEAEPAVVGQWDRLRVEQVVSNLLANAIKFGLGEPIVIKLSAAGNVARLEVIDQGVGIPVEQQPRIFQPFERLVSPRHYGGLGLGLHIVRVIVTGLGGTVRVASAAGQGSTFTVELPMERGAA